MKRVETLRGLSSDHHNALVLARGTRGAATTSAPQRDAAWRHIRDVFENQLEPHFAIEERYLLPELAALGHDELVARTLAEHSQLRKLVAHVDAHESVLLEFAALLVEHVRFEERVLFEYAQNQLAPAVLQTIARAASGRSAARKPQP